MFQIAVLDRETEFQGPELQGDQEPLVKTLDIWFRRGEGKSTETIRLFGRKALVDREAGAVDGKIRLKLQPVEAGMVKAGREMLDIWADVPKVREVIGNLVQEGWRQCARPTIAFEKHAQDGGNEKARLALLDLVEAAGPVMGKPAKSVRGRSLASEVSGLRSKKV